MTRKTKIGLAAPHPPPPPGWYLILSKKNPNPWGHWDVDMDIF